MKKSKVVTVYILCSLFLVLFSIAPALAQQAIKKSKQIETINGKKFYLHTVEKKQTLYSIAKTYETTVNLITATNPEVIDGLQIGSKIKIPFLDTPIQESKKNKKENKNTKSDTASALAAATPPPALSEPIKPIGDIHVGLFLPLALNSEENLDPTNTLIREETKIGIEFYEGFKMAVDSIKKTGFKGTIHVYDSDMDSLSLESLLKKQELKELDLIIGPLYGKRFDRIQKFAKTNKINIVSPTIQANHILMGNPHVSKVTPSYISQAELLAKYIAEKYAGNNIIAFNSANIKDRPYINAFKKTINNALVKTSADTVKEMTFTTLPLVMSRTKANMIVLPSTNPSFITEAINKLFLHKQESMQQNLADSIHIFGFSNWEEIESIDFRCLKTLNATITSYSFVDYNVPQTKNIILNYRSAYKTEPTKYVFLGFDVAYYYLTGLQKWGNELPIKLPQIQHKGIQTEFNFVQSDITSGYENRAIGIMKFENFSFIRVK
jgi:ABC-type branched-subunit amino acid transport system substrate-binding protein